MKIELYGKAIDVKRFLLLVVAPIACIIVAAAILLPASLMQLALMLLFALPFVFLCFDRPEIVFYFVILILFSNLDAYAPFRLYRYLLIFLFASLAIAAANGRRLVTHHPNMIALAVAFTIIAFQSISVARDAGLAVWRLVSFLKVLASVVVVVQFARNREEFKRFLLVLAVGILLSGYLPFVVNPPGGLGSLSLIWNEGIVRYEGFVSEPNTFALFQLFLIPVLAFFAGTYRKPRVAGPLFSFLILASVGILILSFSRGGFFGLASLLVTLVVVERRNKPLFVFGLALIAASAVLVPGVYWERIGSIFDFATKKSGDFSIWTRLETMRVALRMGLAHPLLGVGIENFIPNSVFSIPYALTVHSVFLQIFAELGFVALSLFVAIIVCNFRIIRRMMRNERDPEAARIGRALCVQHVAMLTALVFLPHAYEMVVWFMLTLPAIADYAYRRESGPAGAVALVSSGRK